MRNAVSSRKEARSANPPGFSRAVNSDVDPNFYYTDVLTQKTYPSWMVAAVDELIYKVRHMNIWKIVDFCIDIWAKKHPKEHKLFLKDMVAYRKNRKNSTSSTDSKSMRELAIVPREITFLLDKIAFDKINDYGKKKFWREFSKRYPGFRPGEKF